MASSVEVGYFAAIADAAGCRRETLHTDDLTVGGIRSAIRERHGDRAGDLAQLCSILSGDELLRDPADPIGAAVDVLPPFAGG